MNVIYEPFEEYVKQVVVKLLNDTSDDYENGMNLDIVG